MDAMIRAALRWRVLTLILTALLALAGLQAWRGLPIDAFPEISPTQTKIIIKAPGMTPEEVEQRVVRPIEQELLSIPRKRMVRSMSKYGIGDITIDFDEGTDIYWARQQVSERLGDVRGELPAGISGGLAPITTPLSEMVMFTIEGDFALHERRRVLDWVIRPALRTIAGVADVNSLGGEVRTFEVIPDLARMSALGLSMGDLRQALQANNGNDGAGQLLGGDEALAVRVEGAIRTLDDLRALRIALPADARGNTRRVMLEEVASVRYGALTRYGAVTQDGRGETVQGIVLGLRGVNARQLVDGVQQKLSSLRERLPQGMEIRVFYDRGALVQRATGTVIRALIESAVLVCVVLYLFLGGLRAALVVASALPLSLLATFVLMERSGQSANLMSLGGLAIALGMLVDASVVVVENIEASLARTHDQALSMAQRVLHAVREVVAPVVAGVLIIAAVFLPLLTLRDLEGKLFSPVAMTIVMALAASLLLALTAIPALASLLMRPHTAREPWLMRMLLRLYVRARDVCWRHPRWMLGTALASLAAAVVLYGQIGKTFMPTLDEGDILVQVQKHPSVSLEASATLDTRIQQAILGAVPEVRAIVARVGSDELGLDPMGPNDTDTFLVLKPRSEWHGDKQEIETRLRGVLDGFPGVVYSFTQPIEMRVSEMLTGTRGDVAIKLFGDDLAALALAAQKVAKTVRVIHGAAEVIAPQPEGLQYLQVALNRHAIGQAGLSVEAVQSTLKQQLEGEVVGRVVTATARTPLLIRGNERVRESPESLRNLPLVAPDGRSWPLGALADIARADGPLRIDHEQGRRFTAVQVSVQGRDLTGFVQEARAAVAALSLPAELQVVWGGQFENQQRAAARLAVVVPLALVAIVVILTLVFGSLSQATIILLNVPFALVGGIAALALAGEYLSVPASVGFIALLGIAVLNGVVMVSHFNERLAAGESMADAVRRGSERRLRPVLMTAVITALGMLPLLSASGPGSEIQRPLAVVVVGGLITSTLVTLLVLPAVFARWGRFAARRGPPSPPQSIDGGTS